MKNLKFLGMIAVVLMAFSCTDNLLTDIELEQSQKDNPNLFSREGTPSNEITFSSNQLIIQYKEGTTLEQRAALKAVHKADIAKIYTCDGCFDDTFIIELWELVEGIDPIEKKGLLKDGGGGGPEDFILSVDREFSFTLEDDIEPFNAGATNAVDFSQYIANNRGIVIAVVDTGIAPNNPAEFGTNPFLHDSKSSCEPELISGWDFANHDNAPFDDDIRKHGTKVSAVIARNTKTPFSIYPIKVFKGDRSTSYFTILCGVNRALQIADVVNLSFGYLLNHSGNAYSVFSNLLDRYKDVPVITSAGNNDNNNDMYSHFPSSHIQKNIIAVAATDYDRVVTDFSNFGATSVHFGALGENVPYIDPVYGQTVIHGTSYAAPVVTAKVAEFLYNNSGNPYTMTDIINHLNTTGKIIIPSSTKPIFYSVNIE